MPIRRKSTQQRTPKPCRYHEQMLVERANQDVHQARQHDQGHDPTPCWCCCDDCPDLNWFHPPRKGVWWVPSPSGELQLTREICDESPGSPETSPS